MIPPWREERAEMEERGPSFAPGRAFVRVGLASLTEETVQFSLAWPARFLPFPFRRHRQKMGCRLISLEKLCGMSGFRSTAKN